MNRVEGYSRSGFAIFILLLVALFLSSINGAFAGESLTLREGADRYAMGKHLSYLEDETGLLTLEDVMTEKRSSSFIQSTTEVPNFSFTKSAYWFRFDLANQDSSSSEWLLEFQYPSLDRIDAYILYGPKHIVSTRAGDTMPFAEREVKHRHSIIKIALDKGQTITAYVRVETMSSFQVPLVLWNQRAFSSKDHDEQFWLGIYYGIFFAMFCYNLMILLSIRDISYFYYLCYLFGFGFFQLSLNGLAFEYLWPESPMWVSLANQFFIGCAGIGITQFSRTFLQMKKTMPLLDKISGGFFWTFVLVVILTFWAPVAYVIRLGTFAALTQSFMILYAAIICLYRGVEQAKYFIIAWSLLLIGIIIFSLKTFGVLPSNFITDYGLQIGSAIEVVLLSLALAHRIRVLKGENERIQYEAALMLEQRVQERTLDLDRALTDLSSVNEQLKDISHLDALTGAKNRSYFDEQAALEWRRAFRRKSRIGLLMIDIDHFKQVNDTYGHLGGDTCLKEVARAIKHSIHRSGDDLFRYGGEEFAVILPDTDTEGCSQVATSVCNAIRELDIFYDGTKIAVTVSIGLACLRPQMETIKHTFLIAAADKALYEAKRHGRNQVYIDAESALTDEVSDSVLGTSDQSLV